MLKETENSTKTSSTLAASRLKVPQMGNLTEAEAAPPAVLLSRDMPVVVAHKTPIPAETLPFKLHRRIDLIKTPGGKAYGVVNTGGNPYALAIGSKKLNAIIAEVAREGGTELSKKALVDINAAIESHADLHGRIEDVWLRVAPIDGGIEIDSGNDLQTRVRITAGKVEIVDSGSAVLFFRTSNTKPIAMPAPEGNWQRLKKFLNVHPADMVLLVGWITYVLAHPKVPTAKYPILVLQAAEGSGKSTLCNLLIRLVDPSALGIQVFPHNATDLAIAGQHSHLLCFDNLRSFKPHMADMLCIAATGGTLTTRQLYTDADQQAIPLHVALVLNGITQFIDWPDLAQRCLPIHLKPIDAAQRKSEEALHAELQEDLPAIMRGLFDLIANVFLHLPRAEITSPERMIEFVAWLAAMEKAEGVPTGVYQSQYSQTLRQGQLDTLMDNPLAAAIIEFADMLKGRAWADTPSELLAELNRLAGRGTQFSREWPQNPIALSKRIASLQSGLRSQDIRIELSRGKNRIITLTKNEVLA